MCRWMSPRVIVDKRFMLWATLGLAAAYASFIALSQRLPSESDEWLLARKAELPDDFGT